jgi:hypothetical protein
LTESRKPETCLPVAAWFLFSERNEPLGQVYRRKGEEVPMVGDALSAPPKVESAVIIAFEELRSTCAMRRFRVVLKLGAP